MSNYCKALCDGIPCNQITIRQIDKESVPVRTLALTGRKPHWTNDTADITYHYVHESKDTDYCFYHTQVRKGLIKPFIQPRFPKEVHNEI